MDIFDISLIKNKPQATGSAAFLCRGVGGRAGRNHGTT